MTNYKTIANDARKKVLEMIWKAKTSHIGSNFSCIDILAVLFEKIDLDKDKFILSAGWKAAALYYFLWRKGRITEKELNSYCMPGSKFIGLAEPIIPEIPFAGGSMGMGLPSAVGFALAKKLKGEEGTIYCLMSDGEMQIGTTWESALIASHHKLNNLVVLVDWNQLQAMGKTIEILNLNPIRAKFESFGWSVQDINGHDYNDIDSGIRPIRFGIPNITICNTVKGAGVSFMKNNNLYHYKQLSDEEYQKALQELHG